MPPRLIRGILIAVVLLALTLSGTSPPAVGNQSGPNVNDQIWGWSMLCVLHGGEATIDFHPPGGGDVSCKGGGLGGLVCFLYSDASKSWCDHNKASNQAPGPWAASTIDPATLPLIVELPSPTVWSAPPRDVEPQVLPAQVIWPVSAGATLGFEVATYHACRIGGGTPLLGTRQTQPGDGSILLCTDGVFAGHTCDVATGLITCFTDPTNAAATMLPEPQSTLANQAEATADLSSTPSTDPTEVAPTMPPPTD